MQPTRRGFLGGLIGGFAAGSLGSPSDARAEDAEAPEGTEIDVEVNGRRRVERVGDDETALSFVRERCGLTGAKLGCGHGACGACAIQVDGTPVASCLLPAAHLHGKQVRTVEAFQPLHPVQRAFMAEDALQCGYCTPGFVVQAAAFVDRWRAAYGDTAPSRDVIAAALAGHLCRCGAYPSIFAAVAAACEGRHDLDDPVPPRAEARQKVDGSARYTVDVLPEGCLVGRVLRSPNPSGRVARLDLEPALRVPGVVAAVRLVSDTGTVRYAGQELAAVAALDEAAAEAGLEAIALTWELGEPSIGFERATRAGAAVVFARSARDAAGNANEAPLFPARWAGNERTSSPADALAGPSAAGRGIERARAGEGTLFEGRFTTQAQHHTPLEPRGCVANVSASSVEVWASTQSVHATAADIAERWGLRRDQVVVHSTHIGGGFGSKVGLQMDHVAAIELSRSAGRPVRVILERASELKVGGHRPAQEMDFALACDPDGRLVGMEGVARVDTGTAVGSATSMMWRLTYPDCPKRLVDVEVTTHTSPARPFRAPSGPPAFFALEQAVDAIALERGLDPLELRRRWDPNPVRNRLYRVAEQLPLWRDRPRPGAESGRFRRGVGLAIAGWAYFVVPWTQVRIDAGPGGIVASSATQDIGNGTRTVIARTVARVLGLSPTEIEVRIGDSRDVPGPMSAGSRTTASVVPAAQAAAEDLVEAAVEAAATALGGEPDVVPGGLQVAGSFVAWREVFERVPPLSVIGRRPRDPGGYFIPLTVADTRAGKGINGAVVISEVEVDTRLGVVRARRIWTGVGCGTLIAPELARSQVEGGVLQATSYALYEEKVVDRHGRLLTHNLEDYRIAGIGDCPEIDVHFDTEPWEDAFGPVGIAEISTCAPAAAIANAVVGATGWRPTDLPIRPDRVLAGIAGRST